MVPELRKVRQKKPGWPRTYWDESILDSTAPVLSWVDPLSTPGVLSQVPHQSLPPAPGDTQHPPNHPPLDGLAVMSVLSLVAILGTTAKTAGNFLGQKKPSEPSHPSGWERESFSTAVHFMLSESSQFTGGEREGHRQSRRCWRSGEGPNPIGQGDVFSEEVFHYQRLEKGIKSLVGKEAREGHPDLIELSSSEAGNGTVKRVKIK